MNYALVIFNIFVSLIRMYEANYTFAILHLGIVLVILLLDDFTRKVMK